MMLTGGLSINPKVDAEAICTMSLELLSFIGTFTHPRIEGRKIQMKTTIHTGEHHVCSQPHSLEIGNWFKIIVQDRDYSVPSSAENVLEVY